MAKPTDTRFSRIKWPFRLTWAGLIAERLTAAFWPFWSVVMVGLSAVLLGLGETLSGALFWAVGLTLGIAAVLCLGYALWLFRFPSRAEALARLDASMPGRPLQAMMDAQAIGASDPASISLWQAHQARMAQRLHSARRVAPNLQISKRDPFALRYVAVLGLAVALLFGSLTRMAEVGQLGAGTTLAGGPSWEGWIEPPAHTGLPVLYLADQPGETLEVFQGSQIVLRLYGTLGQLTLTETVSARLGALAAGSDPEQQFRVVQSGEIRIVGQGGHIWNVTLRPDLPPSVAVTGPAETSYEGQMSLPFEAKDDFAILSGRALISLDLAAINRRFGLALDPEPQSDIERALPLPIAGDRSAFEEVLVDDFSQHPWAHLPVTVTLEVSDAAGQIGTGVPVAMALPARRFFDPLAAAVIEQRRDLLWNRQNAKRIVQIMRAISWKPEAKLFRSETTYLRYRVILRRLETYASFGLSDVQRDEIATALWDLALQLEEGDIGDALERMERAQERLSEAMKNGASEDQIAELMQELREATQDYLRQLSRQAQQDPQQQDSQSAENQNTLQMDMNDLQAMMDRIQELMEQGRMAEAQQALQELQQLMENMQVTQGEGQNAPGQEAMEELSDTLRQQQGLSDQAFRDLQEQFNPGATQGQSQNNEGRNGGQGRGQSHEGQNGQGEGNSGEGSDGAPSGEGAGSLADRQQALRDELNRQRGALPGLGGEAGQAARDALESAERSMQGAGDALKNNDLAGAIDKQAEAMDNLREGIRSMGEALAEAQREQQGQGQAQGNPQPGPRDPLGRDPGQGGALGGDENLLQGDDVYRRARELLDEIRRRSGEGARPEEELNYLKRLLDRF